MPYNRRKTFEEMILGLAASGGGYVADTKQRLPLGTLDAIHRLRRDQADFAGRNVLVRTRGQLAAVVAAIALDGLAKRLLLCPPDVRDEQIPDIIRGGEVELTISDDDINIGTAVSRNHDAAVLRHFDTEWVLFTSGTSGMPKLVLHSFASLTAPLHDGPAAENAVWSTFYDIRRYGGLQILLRALICGGSMLLSEAEEHVTASLTRLGEAGVTHVSGTPSHWRRALMSGAAARMAPGYVRLSGEMAGQDILDRLHAAYPQARIGHAFASTEAGVAFSVNDGQAGFPAAVLEENPPHPLVRIENGTLRICSNATASGYLGESARKLIDEYGFVDTGDVVERSGERYIFVGRREGVVNVGGQKVHPEEVEAAINLHPGVAMSRVWGRASPITGALITADIVLTAPTAGQRHDFPSIRDEIMATCRAALAPHKVPVRLNHVVEIPMMTSGKIERRHA